MDVFEKVWVKDEIEQLKFIFRKELIKLVEDAGGFYPDSGSTEVADKLVKKVKKIFN